MRVNGALALTKLQMNGKVSDIEPEGKLERQGPIKCKKITHRPNSEIRHKVHPTSMYFIDGILPLSNIAHVRVQNAEIEWGVH